MSRKEGKRLETKRFHMCPADRLMMLMMLMLQQVCMWLSFFFFFSFSFFLSSVLYNHWFSSITTRKGYSFVPGGLRLGLARLMFGQGLSITTKKSGKCQV